MNKLSLCLAITCVLTGCSKESSTKGWASFQSKSIKQQHHETGAWGGYSYIHWEADKDDTFQVNTIKQYATTNRWTFVSEQACSAAEVNQWKKLNGKDIFPLGFDGFVQSTNVIDSTYDYFPRWITEDLTLLKFDTHWLITIGGKEKPAYAYIIITRNGRKMAVYHLFGE